MAIGRVGLPRDQFRLVDEALFARSRDHAPGYALIGFDRAELGGEIVLAADAFARHPGIEEERTEIQLDRNIGHERERALDPVLADIAPGAHHIGDDIDLERF